MNPILEIAWPAGPGETTLLLAALKADSVTPVTFTTGATIGAKAGSFNLIYDGDGCSGAACYAGLWPWAYAMNYIAGDMTTNIGPDPRNPDSIVTVGDSESPWISWRGVPSPLKGTPMLMLLPSTKYFVNLLPMEGNPRGADSFGVRFQLSAGRLQ